MNFRCVNLSKVTKSTILFFAIASVTKAGENIIQQGNLSFDKCLNVIEESQDKLSLAPTVKELSALKRLAVFNLNDGILIINCDGEAGTVKVSTKTD